MEPQTFSTRRVGRAGRISAWEAHHERALVGLACVAPRSGEFDATVRSARVGPFDVAHVVATPHAVRRTRAHIVAHDAPGRAIYLTRRGDARLISDEQVLGHGPGSAVVCATDRPFSREFRGGVDEIVIAFSDADAAHLLATEAVPTGRLDVGATATMRLVAGAVHRRVMGRLASSGWSDDDLIDRIRLLLVPGLASTEAGRRSIVLDFVDAHLDDTRLNTASIAARLDLTDRTMRRLFSSAERSLAEEIRMRRLSAALHMLRGTVPIGEIAGRCGFASHPHFSRAFRMHYGCTPREVRSGHPV